MRSLMSCCGCTLWPVDFGGLTTDEKLVCQFLVDHEALAGMWFCHIGHACVVSCSTVTDK